jgi:hypothetical protein
MKTFTVLAVTSAVALMSLPLGGCGKGNSRATAGLNECPAGPTTLEQTAKADIPGRYVYNRGGGTYGSFVLTPDGDGTYSWDVEHSDDGPVKWRLEGGALTIRYGQRMKNMLVFTERRAPSVFSLTTRDDVQMLVREGDSR